jgi:hypothetical protein
MDKHSSYYEKAKLTALKSFITFATGLLLLCEARSPPIELSPVLCSTSFVYVTHRLTWPEKLDRENVPRAFDFDMAPIRTGLGNVRGST